MQIWFLICCSIFTINRGNITPTSIYIQERPKSKMLPKKPEWKTMDDIDDDDEEKEEEEEEEEEK